MIWLLFLWLCNNTNSSFFAPFTAFIYDILLSKIQTQTHTNSTTQLKTISERHRTTYLSLNTTKGAPSLLKEHPCSLSLTVPSFPLVISAMFPLWPLLLELYYLSPLNISLVHLGAESIIPRCVQINANMLTAHFSFYISRKVFSVYLL